MTGELSEEKMDLLRELGNIGMGNAASSLSVMLQDEKVSIHVPQVSIVSLSDLPDNMGGPERVVVGLFVKVEGDIGLYMVYIQTIESAESLVRAVTEGVSTELDELGRSAVAEVGNIVTAGYLNALSDLTDLTLMPEPPGLAIDLTEAILGTILAEGQVAEDFIVFIKTAFQTGDSKVEGFLSIIPKKDALDVIYNKLLKGA